MTNQLYENMKLHLFLYLHTLPFDKLPLPLDGKKTKFSPMHQTWPSLALSFSLLWELPSLSISSKSLSQLPSPPSLCPLGKGQDCKPATAPLTSAGGFWAHKKAQASLPCHVATPCGGDPDTLSTLSCTHPMALSYAAVPKHICQPLVFMGARGKKQTPASCSRFTLQIPRDTPLRLVRDTEREVQISSVPPQKAGRRRDQVPR